MRRQHSPYLDWPFSMHVDERVGFHGRWWTQWLLIIALVLLTIFLIGVSTIGGA